MVDQNSELLGELMLHASRFCSQAEELSESVTNKNDQDEFKLKLGQARNALERLQEAYNEGTLETQNKQALGDFRQLVIALMWIAFYVRHRLDFKLFRMLVSVEAGFTYLLIK